MRRTLAATCAAALILAACAESPSPSASGKASASGEPSASAEASADPSSPFEGAWVDVTAEAIGETEDWSNKVELADINADGEVDLLFANGGAYETPGENLFRASLDVPAGADDLQVCAVDAAGNETCL